MIMRVQLKEEILKMKFSDIYGQFKQKRLSCEEAAEILGISVSTFYRKRQRYESEDFMGRYDMRLGKHVPNKAADREVEYITRLYNSRYKGFSVQHFYEFARREHNLIRSYNWTRTTLQKHGVIGSSTRGGKHRLRRERKPMSGMMLHQDGSTHHWILALDYDIDLIVTMDDATSKITSAFFVEEEGTASSFQGIHETIESEGLFCSFYTDRASHYFNTPKAGGKVDKSQLTQVGRALYQLGIEHIPAYSPEARGRSERMFGTLQDRLPKELNLYGITTMEEANKYLKEVYLPRHNEQFSMQPSSGLSAFKPWSQNVSLKDFLCVQEKRTVQCDNTVRYKGLILQIPKNEFRHHYIKAKVDIHEYPNGEISIFYGHLCIGEYDPAGNLYGTETVENDTTCGRSFRSCGQVGHGMMESVTASHMLIPKLDHTSSTLVPYQQ